MAELAVYYYVYIKLRLPKGVDPETYLPLETALEFLSQQEEQKIEKMAVSEEDDNGIYLEEDDELPIWVIYRYEGELSQQQLDYLIEREFQGDLTWIDRIGKPGSVMINHEKFPVVGWESRPYEGGDRYLLTFPLSSPDYLLTDIFKDGDTFLSFMQQRYAGTHDRFCQCRICQKTKGTS